jgi:pimeloyl-ACP methyl ester carboxylesterase
MPTLSAITCPTLVIVGDEDEVTPKACAETLHHAIAGSTLEVIAGSGHLSSLEQPRAFDRALRAFLERVSGASATMRFA